MKLLTLELTTQTYEKLLRCHEKYMEDRKNTAETSLKVDRTKYGIQYGSGSFFDNLGDKTINDEFELKVKLVF